jgi:putative ABC transport system permease protein
MFFTYLWRELRRRMRQAVFISLGLALGVGLVITVTAASNGVKNSQGAVLHALYGVGTDITVSEPPQQGAGAPISIGFRQDINDIRDGSIPAGTKIDVNKLLASQYGVINAGALAVVSGLHGVSAVSGGLTLSDITVTGTVPSVTGAPGSGQLVSSFDYNTMEVDGVDLASPALGPLSSARLTAGSNLNLADARFDDAVVSSDYATANKLGVNGTVDVGGTNFKVIGIVNAPQDGNPPDVYIPLRQAQSIATTGSSSSAALTNDIDTMYVSAASASDISSVQKEISRVLPSATVTDQNALASQVTGSLASASSLANNLGKCLSVAVLIAAFLLASLLTMAAVSRRVREFGTLKALGWRSRRIIGQVLGESVAIGIFGAAIGVGLGYGGAALIDHLARPLSATVGSPNQPSVSTAGLLSPSIRHAFDALTSTTRTVTVTLTAPVTARLIVIAVVLAIAGGLIAGAFGGWRAARLRPAAALSKVE